MSMSRRLVDLGFRALNRFHRGVWRASGGVLGGRAYGLEMVELLTRGRRSGATHSTMLLVPVSDEERLVVVASKGGDARDPDWYLNLLADPRVVVRRRGRVRPMMARAVSSSEREQLWPEAVSRYPHYESYQRRAGRQIPMVMLYPVDDAASRAGAS